MQKPTKIRNLSYGDNHYEIRGLPEKKTQLKKLSTRYDTLSNEIDSLELGETFYMKQLMDKQANIIREIRRIGEIR